MYGSDKFGCSDIGSIYLHELRKQSGREFVSIYIYVYMYMYLANCLLCSNQLFNCILLDKSNIANDGLENDNFDFFRPVSSSWHCGL